MTIFVGIMFAKDIDLINYFNKLLLYLYILSYPPILVNQGGSNTLILSKILVT